MCVLKSLLSKPIPEPTFTKPRHPSRLAVHTCRFPVNMSTLFPSISIKQKGYYAQDVDFDDLAQRNPEWAAICRTGKNTKWLDFKDPKIVL